MDMSLNSSLWIPECLAIEHVSFFLLFHLRLNLCCLHRAFKARLISLSRQSFRCNCVLTRCYALLYYMCNLTNVRQLVWCHASINVFKWKPSRLSVKLLYPQVCTSSRLQRAQLLTSTLGLCSDRGRCGSILNLRKLCFHFSFIWCLLIACFFQGPGSCGGCLYIQIRWEGLDNLLMHWLFSNFAKFLTDYQLQRLRWTVQLWPTSKSMYRHSDICVFVLPFPSFASHP